LTLFLLRCYYCCSVIIVVIDEGWWCYIICCYLVLIVVVMLLLLLLLLLTLLLLICCWIRRLLVLFTDVLCVGIVDLLAVLAGRCWHSHTLFALCYCWTRVGCCYCAPGLHGWFTYVIVVAFALLRLLLFLFFRWITRCYLRIDAFPHCGCFPLCYVVVGCSCIHCYCVSMVIDLWLLLRIPHSAVVDVVCYARCWLHCRCSVVPFIY